MVVMRLNYPKATKVVSSFPRDGISVKSLLLPEDF